MLILSVFFVLGFLSLMAMIVDFYVWLRFKKFSNRLEPILAMHSSPQDTDKLEAAIKALPKEIAEELAKVALPVATVTLPPVQNNNIEQSTRGKLSKKLLGAAEWVSVNDPNCKLSVRQVAQGAKVSIGTAQAAIKVVQDEKVERN